MDDQHEKKKKSTEIVVAAAAGGASAVLTGLSAASLSAAIIAGLGPLVAGRLLDHWREAQDKRARRAVAALLSAAHLTTQEAAEEIEAKTREPVAQKILLEYIRDALAAVDEEAVGPLGVLAWEYTHQARRPDAFFRDMAGMLVQMSGEEIDCLRELLQGIGRHETEARDRIEVMTTADGHLLRDDREDNPVTMRWWVADANAKGNIKAAPDPPAYIGPIPGVRRVFWLLKRHGLGEDNAAGYFDSDSGPAVLVLRRAVVSRLRRVLTPPQ
jgi:hypothetical protein